MTLSSRWYAVRDNDNHGEVVQEAPFDKHGEHEVYQTLTLRFPGPRYSVEVYYTAEPVASCRKDVDSWDASDFFRDEGREDQPRPQATPNAYAVGALDFLATQGLTAQVDADGDVQFEYGGRTFVLNTTDVGPEFFALYHLVAGELEGDGDRLDVLAALSESFEEPRAGRVVVHGPSVIASVDAHMPGPDAWTGLFWIYLRDLDTLVNVFQDWRAAARRVRLERAPERQH